MMPRPPDSLEEAIKVIGHAVGFENCGDALDFKSGDMVYKWSRGKKFGRPNWHQMRVLERLYRERGGEPIISNLLKRLTSPKGLDPACPQRTALKLGKETGEALDAVERATDPDSPGGEKITPNEAAQISKEFQDVADTAHLGKRSLKAVE